MMSKPVPPASAEAESRVIRLPIVDVETVNQMLADNFAFALELLDQEIGIELRQPWSDDKRRIVETALRRVQRRMKNSPIGRRFREVGK